MAAEEEAIRMTTKELVEKRIRDALDVQREESQRVRTEYRRERERARRRGTLEENQWLNLAQ